MRFSVIVAGFFAAAVSAQTTTDAPSTTSDSVSSASGGASATSSADVPENSAQAAMLACLNACDPADVNCQAKCIAVPSPDTQNVNSTIDCAAACPQGNGTAEDNDRFADCVNDCIGQYYFTSTGTPNLATSSGASGSSGSAMTPSVTAVQSTVTSDGSTFVTSFSSTVAPSGTSSAPTSSSSGGADMLFSPVGSGIGLFSFLAAFLAL